MNKNRWNIAVGAVAIVAVFSLPALLPSAEPRSETASGMIPLKAGASSCHRMPDDSGRGLWPYNSRLIDGTLFAAGTPFHPQKPENSSSQVEETLTRLRRLGMRSIILLNVPADDRQVREEERLARKAGLETVRVPMNAEKVPSASETRLLMDLIAKKAYVHCQWGADRTGAIIATYLRLKHGYSGRAAWEAVIKGGSHAGRLGGLKIDPAYANLILYFWPEVGREDPEVCEKYRLPFAGRLPHK